MTFLMVFLIQNTQNRDARAINLKLNELIRATANARNQMIDIENLSDLELDALQTNTRRSGRLPGAQEQLSEVSAAISLSLQGALAFALAKAPNTFSISLSSIFTIRTLRERLSSSSISNGP